LPGNACGIFRACSMAAAVASLKDRPCLPLMIALESNSTTS
jgi:hypothetical protein